MCRFTANQCVELFQGKGKDFNVQKALMAKSVRDFEKSVSIVSYGFEEIKDFYSKYSSRGVVGNVKIPVLFIQNDDGTVPLFSSFRRLENNNLSGNVMSLVNCLSLTILNVSCNNLAGVIPTSNNFSRFSPNSFVGNPGLCGYWLTSQCCGSHPAETNLVNLRRTIYLIIMSSVDFEEAGHKLLKIKLKPGQEVSNIPGGIDAGWRGFAIDHELVDGDCLVFCV